MLTNASTLVKNELYLLGPKGQEVYFKYLGEKQDDWQMDAIARGEVPVFGVLKNEDLYITRGRGEGKAYNFEAPIDKAITAFLTDPEIIARGQRDGR